MFKRQKHPFVKCPIPNCKSWQCYGFDGVLNCKTCGFPLNPLNTTFGARTIPILRGIVIAIGFIFWSYLLAAPKGTRPDSEDFFDVFLFTLFSYAVVFGMGVMHESKKKDIELFRSDALFQQKRHSEAFLPKNVLADIKASKPIIIDYPRSKGRRKTVSFQNKEQAIQFIEAENHNWWDWHVTDCLIPELKWVPNEFDIEPDVEEVQSKKSAKRFTE